MKVAFDHSVFALQSHGGVSRYFFELASRIPESGQAEVEIVAPVHINAYIDNDRIADRVFGWKFPYRFRGSAALVGAMNRLAVPLAWAHRNADILHETYYSSRPVGNAKRRIVTVYDMIHELFPADFPTSSQVTVAKRAAVARADHVICISENTKQDLLRIMGVDEHKVSVTHLGYELGSFSEIEPLELGRPFLLYVGARSGYKNFLGFLRAYSQSRILRGSFDVIAFGGGRFSEPERQEIGRLGVSEFVRQVSGDDRLLARHYVTASVFVYPSLYEGFGIPPLEAMSHGCPVAASNCSSIPEVAGDGATYFDAADEGSMGRTIEQLVSSQELATLYRARGLARASLFSWGRCAKETLRIYNEMMG